MPDSSLKPKHGVNQLARRGIKAWRALREVDVSASGSWLVIDSEI
jgi:hypothetical protein